MTVFIHVCAAGPSVNKAVLLQMQQATASKEMKLSAHAMQTYDNLSYEDNEKKTPNGLSETPVEHNRPSENTAEQQGQPSENTAEQQGQPEGEERIHHF